MDKNENVSKKIWKEVIDPTSRSVYYWNVLTGDTSWVNPVQDDSKPLPFNERVSHDSKVIIDKLTNKVDRLKFFFDEINLINEVCDHVTDQEINSIMESMDFTLINLDEILDIATPNTKTYKKFLDLKKFLTEQKSYLKNNGYLSDQLLDKVNEVNDEVKKSLENLKRFETKNEELVDDYNLYVEKRKQILTNEEVDENQKQNKLETKKIKKENKIKQDKKNMLKSIHDRWFKASELLDDYEENFEHEINKHKNLTFVNTDKNNPNLIPITKHWYENQE